MPKIQGTYQTWTAHASGNPEAYLVSVTEISASGNYLFEYNDPSHLSRYRMYSRVQTEQRINASGGILS